MYNVLWFLILIDFWLSAIINYQKLIHWVLPDLFLWDHKIKIKSVECGTQILLMIAFDQRMFCDCFWSVHVVWLIAYQIITKPVHTSPQELQFEHVQKKVIRTKIVKVPLIWNTGWAVTQAMSWIFMCAPVAYWNVHWKAFVSKQI